MSGLLKLHFEQNSTITDVLDLENFKMKANINVRGGGEIFDSLLLGKIPARSRIIED